MMVRAMLSPALAATVGLVVFTSFPGSDPQARSEARPWAFRITDASGDPVAARVCLRSARGDSVVPPGAISWVAAQQPGRYRGSEYFYTDGEFEVLTAEHSLEVYVRRGLEHEIVEAVVERGSEVTVIPIRRVLDMNARGYYSGDGHIHPVGGRPDWARLPGRPSFHEERVIGNDLLRTIVDAVDLNYANLLASNSLGDEVHFRDRVVGANEPESDARRILRVSEEYRSEVFGHMAVFGAAQPSDPIFTGLIGSEEYPYDHPTNLEACLLYEADGAVPSFAHLRRQPNIALEVPVDVALGALRAVELQGYAVAPHYAASLWEKLLGCGFDVVITAGTDATLTLVSCLPPGGARVYVDMEGRPFTHENWLDQLQRGRSFTTKGAMLFLTVDGHGPGESLVLEDGDSHQAEVVVEVESLFPWETISLRMNGATVHEFRSAPGNPLHQRFSTRVALSESAWIYAHLAGPVGDHVYGGTNPWWEPTHDAYTNVVKVEVPGRPRRDAASIEFMIDWIEDNRDALEQRDNYGSAENRAEVLATLDEALAVYRRRKAEVPTPR